MTRADVLRSWAGKWRNLHAWRRPLPAVVDVGKHRGERYVGLASPAECAALILDTGCLADGLKTALHELAHLAAPNRVAHGLAWARLYVAGAAEALGVEIDPGMRPADLDRAVTRAADHWLTASGQRQFLRAIGVRV